MHSGLFTLPLQTVLFLRKLCGLAFILQIEVILDLLDSARTPRFPYVSAIFKCHMMSFNLKQFELTLREYIIGSWRELDR